MEETKVTLYEPIPLENSGGEVLEHWLWRVEPLGNLPGHLQFAISNDPEQDKQIVRNMEQKHGIRLSDGWNGGFMAESNPPEDKTMTRRRCGK